MDSLSLFLCFETVFKRYGDVSSSIKLKVRLPIASMTNCMNAYSLYNLNLGAGQVCAGGVKAKDSCLGDSGEYILLFWKMCRFESNFFLNWHLLF